MGSEGREVADGVGDVETRDVQAWALTEVPKLGAELLSRMRKAIIGAESKVGCGGLGVVKEA